MSASISSSLTDFFKELLKPEARKTLRNHLIAFALAVITCVVIYISSTDKSATTNQFYLYATFAFLPIVVGAFIVSTMFSEPISLQKLYFLGGVLFMLIVAMYMFYRIMNPGSIGFVTGIFQFLAVLGFIVGLAIIYRVFVRSVANSRGWGGFFMKILFFLPCLLMDTMEYLFEDLKHAPRMVFVLFVLEILILLGCIYLPKISNPLPSNSFVLLNEPVFLGQKTTVGDTTKFRMDAKDVNNPAKDPDTIRTNYAISMWIYLNQHPSSLAAYAKETDIFRYGKINSEDGNPRLAYFNDTSDPNKSDKYLLYPSNASAQLSIPLSMPAQSWNQLVVNYADNGVDVFVNGDLVKSHRNLKMPAYGLSDVVEVGYGDNTPTGGGLQGAICNVVYHKRPLSAFEIAGNYNLNRYKNPPVNR
jgi:hypothetical protein